MTIQLARHLFTVEEYDRMIDAGILTKDDHVELLEGDIVEMPPIGSHHSGTVNRIMSLLFRVLGPERAIVSVQSPVKLNSRSQPQPDIAVLQGREDFYSEAHAAPEEILLVIEVADSSLQSDRGIEIPMYAGAGIAEVWLVALTDEAVIVYRSPSGRKYQDERPVRRGEALSMLALPDIGFDAEDILGPLR